MAVGCVHGEFANPEILQQVLDFKQRYKPELRFDLGDLVDTTAFRSGARGTPDETRRPEPDEFAALRWIERYQPTHQVFGNHDWRLVELQGSPNAIISYAAGKLWTSITDALRKVKARTKDYDFEYGAFEIGGTIWTHGCWYNESAVRDHAEYFGAPVVMAHLHVPQQVQGRTRAWSTSFCTGTLADVPALKYSRRRRATSRWGHGVVWGEVSDKSAQLWLSSCEKGGTLRFPL
jgi:hypothetical protein